MNFFKMNAFSVAFELMDTHVRVCSRVLYNPFLIKITPRAKLMQGQLLIYCGEKGRRHIEILID